MNAPVANNQSPAPPPPGVISLNIKERAALYAAYMPYVSGGGIFIPTSRHFHIGDEVFILLTLLDDPKRYPVVGYVAWITPDGAQSNKMQGIGVQFKQDESGIATRDKIEELLSGTLMSARPTHTM
jgi:type IV pilus assembly protein PilZ